MYEKFNYDYILNRMLGNTPNDLSKNEGSFIHTAEAPVAVEEERLYQDLDRFLAAAFVDTADREYLILKASEVGLAPHEATPAIWHVTTSPSGLSIRMGERFNCGAMNLAVTGKIADGLYEMTCETPGTEGNTLSNNIVSINYIRGLNSASLTALAEEGTDEESTEDFRERVLIHLRKPAASGNIHDYYNWAMAVDGVGGAKVFPLWDGAGTVKVVIVNSNKRAADSALVAAVEAYIEEYRPVGADVTVASGTELSINIHASIVLKSGYDLATTQARFITAVTEYLQDMAFDADYVSYAWVGNLLIDTLGVKDYANLQINNGTSNIVLTAQQVAVPGNISLEVIIE